MLLIHGVYHFRPRMVAFRDDFCITCQSAGPAIQTKTIDVLHIYGIPILPLGVYGRWHCLRCGRSPDVAGTARQSIKILAAVTAALLAIPFWLTPIDPENAAILWSLRLGCVFAAIGTLWWIAAGSDDVERRRRLAELPPNYTPECPLCNVVMLPGERWHCPRCGIVRA
jgi:hypothetical protein